MILKEKESEDNFELKTKLQELRDESKMGGGLER
ncbi:hypothetical protein LCGC14_1917240, partial [marine sediment metagenome]